jgi:hypothetical protein
MLGIANSVPDPCNVWSDPDPRINTSDPALDLEPALFVNELQDANKNLVFL